MVISIRKLEEKDLYFLLEVRNDITTRTNLENDCIFTFDQCIEWFKNTNPNWFIIEVNNVKVGYIRTNGDFIGIDIHPKYRRLGYAYSAYSIFLKEKRYAKLWVFDDNFAKKLYKKLGFKDTGIYKMIRNRKYSEMIYENS